MNEATKQTSNLICENSRHLEIHGSEHIIEYYESQKSRSFLFNATQPMMALEYV